MAILNEIQNHVDEIMRILNDADCDENVGIHVTRNVGVIGFTVEKTYYSRNKNSKWQNLQVED